MTEYRTGTACSINYDLKNPDRPYRMNALKNTPRF